MPNCFYEARERARWMRPDAACFIRLDAARFLKPGTRVEDVFPMPARKYSPNQPRVPAGSGREIGQWTSGSGALSDAETLADTDPENISAGEQYANVIRVCIASGISRSKDRWGNQSYTVTYDCAGGNSITKSGFGNRIRGIILDPFR